MSNESITVDARVRLLLDYPTKKTKCEVPTVEEFHGLDTEDINDLRAQLQSGLNQLFTDHGAVRASLLFMLSKPFKIQVSLENSRDTMIHMIRATNRFVGVSNDALRLVNYTMEIDSPNRVKDLDPESPTPSIGDPIPSCVRWVLEDGKLVAKYNFKVVINPIGGPVIDDQPTLHLAIYAYIPMEQIQWGPYAGS